MTRREEIAHLFGVLGDTFARLAVLYHESEPPSGGKVPATSSPQPAEHDEPADVQSGIADGTPRDGRALFLWAKGNGLLPRVEALGRARKYARLAKDWTPDQVADIFQVVTSKAKPGSYRQAAR